MYLNKQGVITPPLHRGSQNRKGKMKILISFPNGFSFIQEHGKRDVSVPKMSRKA